MDPALLFGAIVDSSADAICVMDVHGTITLWNQAAARMFGYTEEEALGQSITFIVPRDRQAHEAEIFARARSGERPPDYETMRVTKAGRMVPVSVAVSPVADGGAVSGVSHIARDVTLLTYAQHQASHLSALVASSDDAIASKDLNGIVQTWNPAAERLFGYTAAEVVGQSIRLIIPDERWPEEDEVLRRVRQGERIDHFETIRRRKDGSRVPISLTVSPIRDAGGRIVGASKVARDISERNRADRDRNRLAAIVDSSDDAIVSKDLNGVIQSWNRGAERMFGYTEREAIGRPITMIIPADRLPEEDEVLTRVRLGVGVDHYETVRQRKDGTMVPVSLTVSPIRDGAGAVVGASKIARDLSALRTYATTLEQAIRTAEHALRMRDQFLATLSHELRTPLNAIAGWVHILTSNPPRDKHDYALTVIDRNTRALTRLIEDLVDVSRIVTGNLTLQIRATDVRKVIDAALDAVRPAAQARSIDLRVDAPPLDEVAADADRLQQVIWNLLSNAVKFTPEGGRIEVTARAAGGAIEVAVADSGPGIDPDFLPRVFDRFSQQDGGFTREHGGMGLGLAIVRHLVELHGGTVAVSSSPGKGATFIVRIPATRAALSSEPAPPTAAPVRRLTGVRVLVVDDESDGREAVAEMLQSAGASVEAVGSAAEAYPVLKTRRPDVLLCDIGMPEEDGLSFVRRMRSDADRTVNTVPAIALSAYARPQDHAQAIDAGFQSHLAKPVRPADLVQLVERSARRSG